MPKSFLNIGYTRVIIIPLYDHTTEIPNNSANLWTTLNQSQSAIRLKSCLVFGWNISVKLKYPFSHQQFWSEVLTNSDATPHDIKAWNICFPSVVSLMIIGVYVQRIFQLSAIWSFNQTQDSSPVGLQTVMG